MANYIWSEKQGKYVQVRDPGSKTTYDDYMPTAEAVAADDRIAKSTPENDPDNWTFLGSMGWVYTGEDRFDTTETKKVGLLNTEGFDSLDTDYTRYRNTGNKAWLSGADHLVYDQAAFDRNSYAPYTDDSYWKLQEAVYGVYGPNEHGQSLLHNPFNDVFWYDVKNVMDMYKQDQYNPFYFTTPDQLKRNNELTNQNRTFETVDNNIADYLYGNLKDISMVKHRGDVERAYNSYIAGKGMSREQAMKTAMTQQIFDEMGLGNYFAESGLLTAPPPSARPPAPPSQSSVLPSATSSSGMLSQEPAAPTITDELNGLFGTEWQRGTKRTGTWGSGHSQGFTNSQFRNQAKSMYEENPSLLGEDTESMRQAVITALENKLLG